MSNVKARNGKGYEFIVFGYLIRNGFDLYQTIVDDQGIDGILRYVNPERGIANYFEIQVKGARAFSQIRVSLSSLPDNVLLFMYSEKDDIVIWLFGSDINNYFQNKGMNISDIQLKNSIVNELINSGYSSLDKLIEKLNLFQNE